MEIFETDQRVAGHSYTSATLTRFVQYLLVSVVWDLSFGIFRLGPFVWDHLLGTFRLGSFVWKLSFEILRLGTFVWIFRLEAVA